MQPSEPCQRCAALPTDEPHARCPARTCGCSCRDLRVDLHSPETRLAVAQLCQSLLRKEFVKGHSPEAAYVNAIVQDLLFSEMESLTGATVQAGESEDVLVPDEVRDLRALLAKPALGQSELDVLRQLIEVAPFLLAAVQRRRPTSEEPQALSEPAAPPRPIPAPRPAPRPGPGTLGPLPMPSRSAIGAVTAGQAARQAHIAAKAANRKISGQLAQSATALAGTTETASTEGLG